MTICSTTVVFGRYPDDFAAFGGINAIRARGLRIPEDISVAGYDGIAAARYLEPQLTTLKQDAEQIGCVAARQLISLPPPSGKSWTRGSL